MDTDRRSLIAPVLLITVGVGWLLTSIGVAPRIDWVWTLGLAVAGLLTFAVNGVDKFTIVIAPLFISASLLSIFRQTGHIDLDIELSILVILAGVLLLVGRWPAIPEPRCKTWVQDRVKAAAKPQSP